MASIFEHVRDILNKTVPGTSRKRPPAAAPNAPAPQAKVPAGPAGPAAPGDGQIKAPDLQAELHKRDAEIRAAVEKATAEQRAVLERQQQELIDARKKLEAELAAQAQRHVTEDATTYTIVRGDTLSGISRRFLGSAARWHEIHQANKDTISNPNLIYPGQVIRIPPR